jgi:hypothetical protein
MAIARCEICGNQQGTKQRYPHSHTPAPETGIHIRRILCGAPNCTREALIWLTDEEEAEYRRGERSFMVLRHHHVRVA